MSEFIHLRKPVSVRMLQLLLGLIAGVMSCELALSAQEIVSETDPGRDAPAQEFEPVDPGQARIPKSWFKNVPVAPVGLSIQPEEFPACLRILDHTRGVPAEKLEEADREFRLEMIEEFGERTREKILGGEEQRARILDQLESRLEKYRRDPFAYPLVRDAFNHAAGCQGEVVSFSGHVRRVEWFYPGDNQYGLEKLYEVWLFDEESNGYPVIILCTEIPDGLPVNFPDNEVIDDVSVRGYFFKLYAYEGGEQFHAIPMILAKTVQWEPTPPVSRNFPPWAYAIVVILGIIAVLLIVRSNSSRTRVRETPEENPFNHPLEQS